MRVAAFRWLYSLSILTGSVSAQPTIHSVIIERHNVFDDADSTTPVWIRSVVNAIHSTTQERVIRNEILFREGDPLQPDLLVESERKLRRLGFVGDVSIRCDSSDRSGVTALIRTHDKWTLTSNLGYKNDGGIRSYGVTLSESNLLGTGNALSAGYDYNSERANPIGAEFIFSGRHLPLHEWGMTLQFKTSEELTVKTFSLDRPFFSEHSAWATNFYADDASFLRREYRDGQIVQQAAISQQNQTAAVTLSTGEDLKYRIGTFVQARQSSYAGELPRRDDNLRLAIVSLGLLERSWETSTFLNSLVRTEDIPFGFAFDAFVGKNFPTTATDSATTTVLVRGIAATQLGSWLYLSPEVRWSQLNLIGNTREATLQYSLLAHQRISRRDLLVWRIMGVMGYNWSSGKEVILGSPNGLRGYSTYGLSGDRMLLMNVESRHLFDPSVWIFRFGGALFLDCGTVWNESGNVTGQRFHTSVGFGLRIENIKQQGSGIIRIDIPYGIEERRLLGITITSSHFLNAFTTIENLSPNSVY